MVFRQKRDGRGAILLKNPIKNSPNLVLKTAGFAAVHALVSPHYEQVNTPDPGNQQEHLEKVVGSFKQTHKRISLKVLMVLVLMHYHERRVIRMRLQHIYKPGSTEHHFSNTGPIAPSGGSNNYQFVGNF